MYSLEKEFQYTKQNFQFIQTKIYKLAGIHLPDTKKELVYSRVSRLVRQYHFKTFDEYCDLLKRNNPTVLNELVNAITTNYTSFMREPHHFEFLKTWVLPELKEKNAATKRIRIWSAGCSSGEEPYSISFVVNDFFGANHGWDIKILATDIDSDILAKARAAIYPLDAIEDMPKAYYDRMNHYFDVHDVKQSFYGVNEKYKQMVHFKSFNLMDNQEWPMRGPFDVIFCRNVMIYFDRTSQKYMIGKYMDLLPIGGHLILGHSESVPIEMQKRLKFIDGAIYRRVQ